MNNRQREINIGSISNYLIPCWRARLISCHVAANWLISFQMHCFRNPTLELELQLVCVGGGNCLLHGELIQRPPLFHRTSSPLPPREEKVSA